MSKIKKIRKTLPNDETGIVTVAVTEIPEVEMDVKARIKEVLVNLLKIKSEELKDEVSLQDSIGVDSTEMVETVIALEKAFSTKLSPKEITKFSTINDIEKVIQSKLNEAKT
jgi:acyl carrier protein